MNKSKLYIGMFLYIVKRRKRERKTLMIGLTVATNSSFKSSFLATEKYDNRCVCLHEFRISSWWKVYWIQVQSLWAEYVQNKYIYLVYDNESSPTKKLL